MVSPSSPRQKRVCANCWTFRKASITGAWVSWLSSINTTGYGHLGFRMPETWTMNRMGDPSRYPGVTPEMPPTVLLLQENPACFLNRCCKSRNGRLISHPAAGVQDAAPFNGVLRGQVRHCVPEPAAEHQNDVRLQLFHHFNERQLCRRPHIRSGCNSGPFTNKLLNVIVKGNVPPGLISFFFRRVFSTAPQNIGQLAEKRKTGLQGMLFDHVLREIMCHILPVTIV